MGERLGQTGHRLLAPFLLTWGYLTSLFSRLTGRLGAATRSRFLLGHFIRSPIRGFGTLFLLLGNTIIYRPLRFTWLSLRAFSEWLFADKLWPATRVAAGHLVYLWQLASRWLPLPGRLRERSLVQRRLEDIRHDPNQEVPLSALSPLVEAGSERQRISRFTTAVVTTSVLLLVGFLSQNQQSQPDNSLNRPLLAQFPPTVTPQPMPTNTPTATPSPSPTPTSSPTPIPTATDPAADFYVPWPTPDPLGKGGSVAFTVRENGQSDIYALTIGRSDPIRLIEHPADDRDPAWSPDGRRLAFASHRDGNWEIYALDLGLNRLTRLTDNLAYDGGPTWSPDGEWLVYESYRDDNLDLYIIASDGSGLPIRLTEHPSQDFSPAWSPDGRHIAYTSWRSGNKDIFIMSLDTASDQGAINVTSSPDRYEDHATFAPDGSQLAYYDDGSGLELVYVLPLDGYRPAGKAFGVGQGSHPSWSADGSSLVYVHHNGTQSYIIASSVDAWNVAPQAYAHEGMLDDLAWSGVILPRSVGAAAIVAATTAGATGQQSVKSTPTPAEPSSAAFLLREIDVDAPAPYLNDRVDDSFLELRQRVLDEAGWDFLGQVDNMFDFLSAKPFPGQSDKSWNKAARAFDFYYRYPISLDPQVEIVREDRGADTYWRVYLRAAQQDGSSGEPLRRLPWDFTARYGANPEYYDEGGKVKDAMPAGYYVDFTAMAADYGWTRVPALENWRTFFQGIRYWHFENRGGLTWDEAILELYSPDEVETVFGIP